MVRTVSPDHLSHRRRPHPWLLPILVAVTACAPAPAPTSPEPEAPAPPAPTAGLLLIGIDSADWNGIDPIADDLPHLSALMAAGARADLQTLTPTLSPNIWTTIATGVRPEEHGINGFIMSQVLNQQIEAADEGAAGETQADPPPAVPMNRTQRRRKAMWNIVSERGLGCSVFGWWVTWPVEPIRGVMVSDRYGMAKAPHRIHPPERVAEIDGLWGAVRSPPLTLPPETDPDLRGLLERWSLSDARLVTLGIDALSDPEQRLVIVYLRGLDPVQHMFWRYTDPLAYGVAEDQAQALGDTVARYYRFVDSLVGDLVDAAGDRGVLVVSDHGMHGVEPGPLPPGRHSAKHDDAPPGIFLLQAPGVRAGFESPPLSVYDVAPLVLHLLGLPVAQDLNGAVPSDLWEAPRTPSSIPTYETGPAAESELLTTPDDEAMIEELRSLGYLD